MTRRVRDLIATATVLVVLFVVLLSINPRMRERAAQLSGGVSQQDLSFARSTVDTTVLSAMAMISGFAADNVYLFALLVVAFVLFVLMVRS